MIELKKILVPTDLSDCSVAASVQARELAARFGAQIHVLFVLDDSVAMVPEPMAMAGLPDIISLKKTLSESLDTWTSQYFGEHSNTVHTLRTGTDYVEILRYAQEEEIDLIILGTHGATGLEHALLGSVTERVVRKSPCPVLTIRPYSVDAA